MKKRTTHLSTCSLESVKNANDYEELIRMYFPGGIKQAREFVDLDISSALIRPVEKRDEIKKVLYQKLKEKTGVSLKWGTLTGVKPLKLFKKLLENNENDESSVRKILKYDYMTEDDKIGLLNAINDVHKEIGVPEKNTVSIYIGIPFCPTRCTYCSFTSNQSDYDEIRRYLDALYKEIDYVAKKMQKRDLKAETVYVGGGTPTTLERDDLQSLVKRVREWIPGTKCNNDYAEFTVEAGRPDTITEEKLEALYNNGVNRISINPQTMKEDTLKIIGRDHGVNDVVDAFKIAKDIGFDGINTDLIAGLPGEDKDDFIETFNKIAEFNPENITVHTLALKKSSKLMEIFNGDDSNKVRDGRKNPITNNESHASEMVDYARENLMKKGYRPYYIYRQKYMADNLENVGYAKRNKECLYNIRIMDEKQTIIAVGAGGSSKVYFPEEDRLERVMNVSNYEIYIDRVDEMIARKKNKLFI